MTPPLTVRMTATERTLQAPRETWERIAAQLETRSVPRWSRQPQPASLIRDALARTTADTVRITLATADAEKVLGREG